MGREIKIAIPIDVPTRETVDFISAYLPANSSLLEVGCGEGHVAAELERRGYRVTGIESEPDAVKSARARGVNATEALWPEVDVETVDAVAFTRSLHHIASLTEAVEKAAEVLRAGGLLLLEDFAFDATDGKTRHWFLRILEDEEIGAQFDLKPDEFVTRLLAAEDPFEEWDHDQHHDLHSAGQIRSAIERKFTITNQTTAPYFYRYLVPVFPENPEAARLVTNMIDDEKCLAAAGEIVLIGRRIVAVKK